MNIMTVKDIEQAITELPRAERAELAKWFEEYESRMWDEEIEEDVRSGRFDSLITEAKADHDAGRSRPL